MSANLYFQSGNMVAGMALFLGIGLLKSGCGPGCDKKLILLVLNKDRSVGEGPGAQVGILGENAGWSAGIAFDLAARLSSKLFGLGIRNGGPRPPGAA